MYVLPIKRNCISNTFKFIMRQNNHLERRGYLKKEKIEINTN